MKVGVVSTANEVAKYILYNVDCTHKKLQKLLYFSYQWYLYICNDSVDNLNNKLFSEPFEAWIHGPVVRSIYNQYCGAGRETIQLAKPIYNLDDETKEIIDVAINAYGTFSANQLEFLSHKESAWLNQRNGLSWDSLCNSKLQDRDIYLDCKKRNG